MTAALEVEALKLRRATAARVAALAVVLGVPALSVGFVLAAQRAPGSQAAAKVAPMITGEGLAAPLGLAGQVLSIGLLLAGGVLVSWSFGREHADGTIGALAALPTSRRAIVLAKSVLLLAWGLAVAVATVALTVLLGLVTGAGPLDDAASAAAGRALAVGATTALLTLPFAWVASALRGYLAGIAALLGVVVATQVLTVVGAGAWFPYAAPAMWAGLGGPEVAERVVPLQLWLALPVALLGVGATVRAWDRMEVR
ncbi:MAG: ABC transporter permease [Actinotalea sp.]|nr:ABC transporter permease [Actinotalea sp.]